MKHGDAIFVALLNAEKNVPLDEKDVRNLAICYLAAMQRLTDAGHTPYLKNAEDRVRVRRLLG